jgi:hypothetical protein
MEMLLHVMRTCGNQRPGGAAWRARARAALLITLGTAAPAFAQPAVTIIADRAASCIGCTTALTPLATLIPPDTSPDLGPDSYIVADSRGRFYVTSRDRRHVHRFSAAGRFEGEIGRPGQGPGEFQRIAAMAIGNQDSLLVLESTRRLTVFTAEHAYARTMPLGAAPQGAIQARDGSIIVAMMFGSGGGLPFHIVRPNGAVAASFGIMGTPRVDDSCQVCNGREMHRARLADRVWSTLPNRYELESWTVDGRLLRSFRVADSKWFSDWHTPNGWMNGSAPRPSSVLQAAEDDRGRVLILGVRAADVWKPMPPPETSGITSTPNGIMSKSRAALEEYLFDLQGRTTETVIEVIDPARGQVISSTRLRGVFRLLDATTIAKIVKSRDDDLYRIEVYRLTLTTP